MQRLQFFQLITTVMTFEFVQQRNVVLSKSSQSMSWRQDKINWFLSKARQLASDKRHLEAGQLLPPMCWQCILWAISGHLKPKTQWLGNPKREFGSLHLHLLHNFIIPPWLPSEADNLSHDSEDQ
jgi:hypothetical protein